MRVGPPEHPLAQAERRFLETAAARNLHPPGRTHIDGTLAGIASFFTRALFREEAARRPGPLRSVDPRVRLAAVLLFLASVSIARPLGTLIAHALLPAAALALSRVRPREFLGAGFLVVLPFSILMAAPAALNLFHDGTVVLPLLRRAQEWRFGPFVLPTVIGVTREGILSAATLLLRVLPSAAAALWLTLSTRWMDLLRALRFLRLPPLVIQVAGMTVCYIHVLLRHSEDVHLGRRSRMVCRGRTAAGQAWAGSRVAASWERGLHLAEEVGAAMTARGFTGEAKIPPGARLRASDRVFLAAVVIFCIGAHLAFRHAPGP
jgi:cobalt/nickel transport system permease protein